MAISHHDREEETLIAYFQQMLADVDDEEFAGEIQSSAGDMLAAPVDVASAQPGANLQVLESANAAIAANQHHADLVGHAVETNNPVAGMEHITTQDMLTKELSIANESDIIDNPLVENYQPLAQAATEPVLDAREFAPADDSNSLQRLLASISPETAVKTEEETVPVQTAVAVEPVVAEATMVDTKQAVQTDTVVQTAEPVVATQVETNVATQVATQAPVATVVEAPVETQVVTEVASPVVVAAPSEIITPTKKEIKTHEQLLQERMDAKIRSINNEWKNVDLGQQFQALFFLAQGVRFAVPLIDLGGIFECDKITQLFGKPSWFMGITDVRGAKINIVDTLRWVMPEIGESPDKYPYLIALGTSQWAIGCDVLEGNRSLTADQVKWREIPGSRPWLAGIVTSDKCALLHVNALISLFNAGANIEDLVRQ